MRITTDEQVHELAARLIEPGFKATERVILAMLYEAQFGPFRAAALPLIPADLARKTGIHRNHIGAAILNLNRAGVILAVHGGYTIVTEWMTWDADRLPQIRRGNA